MPTSPGAVLDSKCHFLHVTPAGLFLGVHILSPVWFCHHLQRDRCFMEPAVPCLSAPPCSWASRNSYRMGNTTLSPARTERMKLHPLGETWPSQSLANRHKLCLYTLSYENSHIKQKSPQTKQKPTQIKPQTLAENCHKKQTKKPRITSLLLMVNSDE